MNFRADICFFGIDYDETRPLSVALNLSLRKGEVIAVFGNHFRTDAIMFEAYQVNGSNSGTYEQS